MFFAGLLQNRNKIWTIQTAKIIHSHLPRTVRKRNLDPQGSSWCFDSRFLNSFAQYFIYFVTSVISSLKHYIRTLVLRGWGCRLKAYVHVQELQKIWEYLVYGWPHIFVIQKIYKHVLFILKSLIRTDTLRQANN